MSENSHVQKMEVAEMRMLQWMCEHTRRDRIRNEDIPDKVGATSVDDKMRKARLRWLGQAMDGFRRGQCRPKKYWREMIR